MKPFRLLSIISVLFFCFLFAANAMADVTVSTTTGTSTQVQASPNQEINSKSEAQPPQIQDLDFVYPPGLFVNASDFRNIMDLLKFIYENPCPYRWQLERWAKGGSVDIIMSTTNEKTCISANDRICIYLDIQDAEVVLYKGAAVSNVKKKTISLQALAELALQAMDYNHNVLEIRARVIAETVYGDAKGLSVGGGGTGIANKIGVTVPAMLGWSKGQTGKVALDGLQAELYFKKVIVFEEEAVKIKKEVEKIWEEQKRMAQEKKEMDKLRGEVEKKSLELKKEQLDRELGKLRNPPPPPAPAAPPPVVPPIVQAPPPVILPPVVKPAAKKIEPCRATLLYEIDDYMPNKGKNAEENYRQGEQMINWLLANESEVRKQGGKIALIGGCDERLVDLLKKTSENYAKNLQSLTGTNSSLASLHPYPTDKDYINPLLGERRARLAKVFLGVVAKRMGVLDKVQPLLRSLPVLSSAKDWLTVPDKPLDEKNRYAMLAVVIGGPDGK